MLVDLRKAGIMKSSLSPYTSAIIIVPCKVPSGVPLQETKWLCVNYHIKQLTSHGSRK